MARWGVLGHKLEALVDSVTPGELTILPDDMAGYQEEGGADKDGHKRYHAPVVQDEWIFGQSRPAPTKADGLDLDLESTDSS